MEVEMRVAIATSAVIVLANLTNPPIGMGAGELVFLSLGAAVVVAYGFVREITR